MIASYPRVARGFTISETTVSALRETQTSLKKFPEFPKSHLLYELAMAPEAAPAQAILRREPLS
jgi:hypothetical protein